MSHLEELTARLRTFDATGNRLMRAHIELARFVGTKQPAACESVCPSCEHGHHDSPMSRAHHQVVKCACACNTHGGN